jgi:hypothetical protein
MYYSQYYSTYSTILDYLVRSSTVRGQLEHCCELLGFFFKAVVFVRGLTLDLVSGCSGIELNRSSLIIASREAKKKEPITKVARLGWPSSTGDSWQKIIIIIMQ